MPSVMRKIFCPEAERSTFTFGPCGVASRSEEHTSELQSLTNLVCRLLLEKKTLPTKCFAGKCSRPLPTQVILTSMIGSPRTVSYCLIQRWTWSSWTNWQTKLFLSEEITLTQRIIRWPRPCPPIGWDILPNPSNGQRRR